MPNIYLPYLEKVCCEDHLGAKGRETKLAILSAAVTLFIEKGVYQTPVRAICEKAGVAKGTFYLYFETKEAVIDALYEYLFHAMEMSFDNVKKPEPTIEGLELVIDDLVLKMHHFADIMRFVHRPEIMAIGKNAISSIEAAHMLPLLQEWAKVAKSKGIIDSQITPLDVRLIYQMAHDLLEREFLTPTDDGIENILKKVKMMIRRILLV